jgi:hypothetical protein
MKLNVQTSTFYPPPVTRHSPPARFFATIDTTLLSSAFRIAFWTWCNPVAFHIRLIGWRHE